jgi:hypothetical protein
MASVHLFDGAGAPVSHTGTTLAAQTEYAIAWQPGLDGYLRELAWYRPASNPFVPTHLRLWDAVLQIVIYEASAIPNTSGAGWKTHTVTTVVPLTAGREYRVSICLPATTGDFVYFTTLPTPPAPLAFAATTRRYNSGACGFPATTNANAEWQAVDVGFDTTPPDTSSTPATPGDVSNELAAWLSTTDGTHSDSAPLQDHTTLATVDTNTAAVKADVDDWAFGLGAAAHGYFGDLKGLISDIKTITDTLPTPIAQLTSIVLDHYTADIDMILAQIDSVLSGLGAQSTDLSGTAGSAVGALSGRTGFPATGWAMSAESDFEDAIAFAEAADVYVLSITSYQPTQPATESPAGLWLPRLGWWCVLNGALATQRQFVDFQQMLLEDQGRRMPGCAIQLKPGTLATVQAWLLA